MCDICGKLGEIFRYSLGKDYGEMVPLEQEMKHIKNYMFIQEIRHGNRLQVFYNIDVDAAHVYIPRFILQPIVENAISHGLGNLTSVGILEISAFEKNDRLYIQIEDDGEGMDQEKVAEIVRFINTAKPVERKKNIGIRNVNQRIKLACGEQYGIIRFKYLVNINSQILDACPQSLANQLFIIHDQYIMSHFLLLPS